MDPPGRSSSAVVPALTDVSRWDHSRLGAAFTHVDGRLAAISAPAWVADSGHFGQAVLMGLEAVQERTFQRLIIAGVPRCGTTVLAAFLRTQRGVTFIPDYLQSVHQAALNLGVHWSQPLATQTAAGCSYDGAR